MKETPEPIEVTPQEEAAAEEEGAIVEEEEDEDDSDDDVQITIGAIKTQTSYE